MRLKSSARTCSHGIVLTAPLSISRTRRSTSSAHAASTFSSGGPSRLSISIPANSAVTFLVTHASAWKYFDDLSCLRRRNRNSLLTGHGRKSLEELLQGIASL